jgi:hypothetical protein
VGEWPRSARSVEERAQHAVRLRSRAARGSRGTVLQPPHSTRPSNLGSGSRANGELLGQLDRGILCRE